MTATKACGIVAIPVGGQAVFCAAKSDHTGRHAPPWRKLNKEVPKYGESRFADQDHPQMQRMQAAELQHHEEQEEFSRKARDE